MGTLIFHGIANALSYFVVAALCVGWIARDISKNGWKSLTT